MKNGEQNMKNVEAKAATVKAKANKNAVTVKAEAKVSAVGAAVINNQITTTTSWTPGLSGRASCTHGAQIPL